MSFSAHQIGKFHELEEEGKPIEQADETNNCSSNPNKAQIISIDAPDITLQELDSISVYSSMRNIALNSLPSIVAMIIEYSIFSLNIVFVGYLDDPISMSGCGLGGITATILVYSVGVGMCGGIDTLVSQAFGRKEFELCKIYLNVSKIAMTLLFIPQLILIFFSEDLFILIGQPIESSNVACRYLIICLPGLFLNTQFECTRRYLLAMGVYYPTMIILAFNFFIHITSLSIFVFILKFGIIGVGVATSITYTMNFILVTLYAELQSNENLKPSWKFDLTIIQCAPEYLKYGFASCFALFLFWWPFELTVVYGGWFDLRQSAGSTILNSFTILLTNVPYGIALTASSFVGYSLGANLPNKAKKFTFSAYIIGFFTSLSVCFIVVVFKFEIMSIYTNDCLLMELIDNSILEYILMLLACLFNCSVNGVLRGMGYQNLLVIFCFVSFWLITLPLTMALLFVWDYSFRGIWIGLMTGNCLYMIFNLGMLFFIDWKKLALEKSKKCQVVNAINDDKK